MFGAPAEQAQPDFGQTIDRPLEKAGVVDVGSLQALVDHCACVDETGAAVKVASLPFQGFAYVNRERWCLRIEMPGVHGVGGSNRFGSAWSFALAGGRDHPNR
jgi:hypothetical protein